MNRVKGLLLGFTAAGSLAFGADAASAATVFNLGTIPAPGSSPFAGQIQAGSYEIDVSFALGATADTFAQFLSFPLTGITDTIQLFSGGTCTATACTGGTLVAGGGGSGNPAQTASAHLGAGSYYYTIVGASSAVSNFSGAVFTAVPEPATWAILMAGIGGVGAMLRFARRRSGIAFAGA